MEKCSMCKKEFPIEALKEMVQIMDRKAYLGKYCPVCQAVAGNNPNYHYLVREKTKK